MSKLAMPVIFQCGFSTMYAKVAYDHAIMHNNELTPEELDQRLAEFEQDLEQQDD